jgi:MYXO-CTERM domain-containing protein
MMSAWTHRTTLFAAASIAVSCGIASANTISFNVFENADNAPIGGLVVNATVIDNGTSADFVFTNTSSIDSSITDIHFEKGADQVLGAGSIFFESAGVNFSNGASPPNPPSSIGGWDGNHYSADSDSPVTTNGINPNESLTIRFGYDSGKNFSDLLEALTTPSFRIAMHIQSVGNGSSVWAVSKPVPAPGAAGLLAGVGLFAARRRRAS